MANGNQQPGGGQANAQQVMQVLQQKIGNIELTLNALIGVLIDEDVVDQDAINEKAEGIIEQIQEQQAEAQGGVPGGHDHDHDD